MTDVAIYGGEARSLRAARATYSAVVRFVVSPGWSRRVGIAGVCVIVLAAVLAPVLAPYPPLQQNLALGLSPPSWSHLFGTDELGRDVFSRVLFASRVDLEIGVVGVTIPFITGSIIGLLAGYYGGWLDVAVGRVIDVFMAFPFLVLVIAIVAMLGPGLRSLYIAIALVGWVSYARILRGQSLSAKRREYILASRALGYNGARIMFKHLLPNVIAPAIVFSMSDFVLDILTGASLGFLGLGVQPPNAEWGAMVADGRPFIITAPWLIFFPGAAIVVTGFFFSFLGEGIADYVRRIDRDF
jgi:peptide/nickel transport system permease protein